MNTSIHAPGFWRVMPSSLPPLDPNSPFSPSPTLPRILHLLTIPLNRGSHCRLSRQLSKDSDFLAFSLSSSYSSKMSVQVPDTLPWDPNCTRFPSRKELPKLPGAPEDAAWVWGKDDAVSWHNRPFLCTLCYTWNPPNGDYKSSIVHPPPSIYVS